MSERNISIEEEDLMLYVDVQPLYIDELENSKNSAAQSAQSAAQSAQSAQNWLDNIISYKCKNYNYTEFINILREIIIWLKMCASIQRHRKIW